MSKEKQIDCIHYDKELDCCKELSDWSDPMPVLQPCVEGACPKYKSGKQLEEMAEVYNKARLKARDTLGSMNEGEEMWYSKAYYEAGYRKQSEWISVEERLPEVRQRVLLYSHHDGVNTGYRADEIGRFYVDKSYPYRPTHWMPLPAPPKGGGE